MAMSSAIMMAGATVSGAISEGEAARTQGEFQQKQGQLNAQLNTWRADDAIERGNMDAQTARKKNNATAGSQKAAMAAQGLDVSEGSAAEAIEQTRAVGAVEEMNIRTNAWREAWGYRAQAINDQAEGDFARIAGDNARRQTLIAGGMRAVSYGASAYGAGGTKSTPGSQTRMSDGRTFGQRGV